MIIALVWLLTAIGALGIFLGYYTNDKHYALVGLTIFFIIGSLLLTAQIEYVTGETTTNTYNGTILQSQLLTYDYGYYNGVFARSLGLSLCAAASFGIALIFLNNFGQGKKKHE